jgi:hypothetical protein
LKGAVLLLQFCYKPYPAIYFLKIEKPPRVPDGRQQFLKKISNRNVLRKIRALKPYNIRGNISRHGQPPYRKMRSMFRAPFRAGAAAKKW